MLRWTGIAASAVLFVVAAAFLAWRSDLAALEGAINDLPGSTVLAVFILMAAGGLLAGWRLKLISAEFSIMLSYRDAVMLFAGSTILGMLLFQFFGQALARSVWLSRQGHANSAGVLVTLYEKGVAAAVSFLLGIIGAWYLFQRLSFDLANGGTDLVKIGLGLSLVLAASAVVGWGSQAAPFLRQRADHHFLVPLGKICLLSTAAQATTMAAYVWATRALAPEVTFADLIAVTSLVMLAASVPISFAGWGLREVSAIVAMGAIGIAPQKAFVIAVLIGLASQAALLVIALASAAQRRPVNKNAGTVLPGKPIDYDGALEWAVPLCVAMAIYFQIYIPRGDGFINVNLADPAAIIGAGLWLAKRFGNITERPTWRLSHLEAHALAATLVLAIAIAHGILVVGPTEWAITNKLLGWFVLLSYAACGTLIVIQGGQLGLVTLMLTFAAAGAAVGLFDIVMLLGDRLLMGASAMVRLSGFAQNPNAFAFQMLLVIICIFVSARFTRASLAMLSIALSAVWVAGSRAVFLALPFTLAAAWSMGAFPRRIFFKAVPVAVTVSLAIAIAPALTGLAITDSSLLRTLLAPTVASEVSDLEHRVSVTDGLGMFFASPVFGGGVGVYLQRQLERSGNFLIIHSTSVWLLAEAGLIGFLAFAIPFVRVLRQEWQRRASADLAAQMIVPLLVAFAITSLAHELLYQRAFWFLFGAGMGYTRRAAIAPASADYVPIS